MHTLTLSDIERRLDDAELAALDRTPASRKRLEAAKAAYFAYTRQLIPSLPGSDPAPATGGNVDVYA